MSEKILNYGRQWISEEDIEAVVKTMQSGWLTQGPVVAEFEKKIAEYAGAKYAVVVNSGTAALHIACLAAGIKSGDEVITSPITFVASANCALYCGAKPIFADISVNTALIDPTEVKNKVTSKTRAIIPVHFAGQSADMEEISKIAQQCQRQWGEKVYVIEDAAHALGGTYKDSKIGSCSYSDMTILSFHPVKHITTFEGGAVLTNDLKLYKRLSMFRSHGITRDPELMEDLSTSPWGYEQHELGFNYRLPDVQCALGITQLAKLPQFVERRQKIASFYEEAFKHDGRLSFLEQKSDSRNSYHLFVLQLPFEKLGGRSSVMMHLKERGIITQVHYIPVHTQPYFKKHLSTKMGDFPKAEEYYKSCLSVPMYPAMSDSDVERVIQEVLELL